jgi:DNA-binding MarR family transcriptional regulator
MSDPVQKLLCETRRVFLALAETADEALLSCGVSRQQRALLELLARACRPVTVGALARATLTPVKETELSIAALREHGWIECRDNSLHWPYAAVALSSKGRAGWSEVQARERILMDLLGANLDEQAVRSTFATLRAIRRLLQRAPTPGAATGRHSPRERPDCAPQAAC